jgi:hypothetical protein
MSKGFLAFVERTLNSLLTLTRADRATIPTA